MAVKDADQACNMENAFHNPSMCFLYEAPIFVIHNSRFSRNLETAGITKPSTPPPDYKSLIHSFLVDGPPTYQNATGITLKEMEIDIEKQKVRSLCEQKILSWSFVCVIILMLILLAILFIVFNV